MSLQHFTHKIWRELASIDLRTLALFRIGLAITILLDLATFWPNLSFFLSDYGLFPRRYAMGSLSSHTWSLFFISGKVWVLHLLFFITLLAALALMIGYRTRTVTVVCWVIIVSLNTRASPFLSGADMQLAVLLFWAMFLPLGARFSVDQALAKDQGAETHTASLSSFAILLQVTYLYLIGALLKTGQPWHSDLTAVQAAISNAQFATDFGAYLLQWPELMRVLTYFVYNLEFYVVFLIFSPFFTAWCRLAAFVMLAAMHAGFLVFLDISFFPIISITGVMLLIPGMVWDWLGKKTEKLVRSAQHAIYYDEPCGFCRKTCLIFRELSLLRQTPVVSAQSDPKMQAVLERENSWIVKRPDGQLLLHWDAVAYVWRRSPILWPLGCLFLPPFMNGIGRKLYQWIADHRGGLGEVTGRFLPYHERVATTPSLMNILVVAPLVTITMIMNIKTIPGYQSPPPPRVFYNIMDATRLGQRWLMFAPYPAPDHMWVEVTGTLANQEKVDLLKDFRSIPAVSPPRVGKEAFPAHRWRKYFTHLKWKQKPQFPGQAFCRRWHEEKHAVPLKKVTITMHRLRNQFDPQIKPLPQRDEVLLDYACTKDKPPKPPRSSSPRPSKPPAPPPKP